MGLGEKTGADINTKCIVALYGDVFQQIHTANLSEMESADTLPANSIQQRKVISEDQIVISDLIRPQLQEIESYKSLFTVFSSNARQTHFSCSHQRSAHRSTGA